MSKKLEKVYKSKKGGLQDEKQAPDFLKSKKKCICEGKIKAFNHHSKDTCFWKEPIKKEKFKKKFPRLIIERYGMDKDGHISFIDCHDEKFGEAIFFGEGSRHYHGFLNGGKYED